MPLYLANHMHMAVVRNGLDPNSHTRFQQHDYNFRGNQRGSCFGVVLVYLEKAVLAERGTEDFFRIQFGNPEDADQRRILSRQLTPYVIEDAPDVANTFLTGALRLRLVNQAFVGPLEPSYQTLTKILFAKDQHRDRKLVHVIFIRGHAMAAVRNKRGTKVRFFDPNCGQVVASRKRDLTKVFETYFGHYYRRENRNGRGFERDGLFGGEREMAQYYLQPFPDTPGFPPPVGQDFEQRLSASVVTYKVPSRNR